MVFGCFGSVADELHFCPCPGLVASRFLSTYCGHLLLLRGFQRCPFGTVWKGCERAVFGLPELGFRWCLAVSDPLPTSFIFALVQAWLRHGFCPPTVAIYFSLEGFKMFQRCPFGSVWKGCERAVFGLPELGFRWCLAVSDPLPTSFIFAFVQAWLRHGFCPPTAAIYFSLEGFKVPFRQRVEGLRTRRFWRAWARI